ncbi:MAG TPA: hypothetical protein VFM01_02465 [Nakamurella sp.]|nr:hypothetical protein [Nakamurella sp.]
MADHGAFTGLPVELDHGRVNRWATILVQVVFAVLVVGLIVSVILWIVVKPDVGALVLAVVFAVGTGLMIIRQALLAERI